MAAPTPLQNLQAAYASVAAKIAEVLANPLPNITVDGVTIDRQGYYRALIENQKLLRQQMLDASGGFQFDEYR